MTRRGLHRALAVGLGLFLALHLANHLAGLWGQDVHAAVQGVLRLIYRNPVVEPLLLAAFAVQAGIGVSMLARRRRVTLQTASGAYLAVFLLIHLGAVLTARWQGTETNLAFAAAGLHAGPPWPVIFALYYGMAVIAVFAHLSVPVGRRHPRGAQLTLALGFGLAVSLVLLLLGVFTPLVIPTALIAAFP